MPTDSFAMKSAVAGTTTISDLSRESSTACGSPGATARRCRIVAPIPAESFLR